MTVYVSHCAQFCAFLRLLSDNLKGFPQAAPCAVRPIKTRRLSDKCVPNVSLRHSSVNIGTLGGFCLAAASAQIAPHFVALNFLGGSMNGRALVPFLSCCVGACSLPAFAGVTVEEADPRQYFSPMFHYVELDEERKAAMVSNLMVILCGDKDASPVVNTGTLNM